MNISDYPATYYLSASWEVCNKVGGIYTVLSTQAKTLKKGFKDKLIYIGPDLLKGKKNPLFSESKKLYASWAEHANATDGLNVRVGRWNIPGEPVAILVDYKNCFDERNNIFKRMWEEYKVDSLHAYGDYDEACIFAYTVGRVVKSFAEYNAGSGENLIFHAHEWMLGMSLLYLRKHMPSIPTLFTTHATTVGRSIAGNGKPLYDYFSGYHGNQMAQELNVEAKHSLERQTAHVADCFTTVSEITSEECEQLLEKKADAILMNGFDNDMVPKGSEFTARRKQSRNALLKVASRLIGVRFPDDTLIVGTSGRYEMRNKGIDVLIESLGRLNRDERLKAPVLAYIMVPAWQSGVREDLCGRILDNQEYTTPLPNPRITHWLHEGDGDRIVQTMNNAGLWNSPDDKVKVVFVPCYIDKDDELFSKLDLKSYYDVMMGEDLSIYPSYYEPWGYTPLESIAFHVPTVTTDLSGFGRWVESTKKEAHIYKGVEVLHRSDSNYTELADDIKETVLTYMNLSNEQRATARKQAYTLSEKAQWKYFIENYAEAMRIATLNRDAREENRKCEINKLNKG